MQEEYFQWMKQVLSSSAIVKLFYLQLETVLLTDAVHCGSKSLTPCQQKHSTIELECLAIQWAVTKCDYYQCGLPIFNVLADHHPLVGLFMKDLHTVEMPRLL